MKFPCTCDTRAFPTREFFRPNSSTSFPAGMLSGFLKMQPALLAIGCVVRRFSCDSRKRLSIIARSAGCARNVAEIADKKLPAHLDFLPADCLGYRGNECA